MKLERPISHALKIRNAAGVLAWGLALGIPTNVMAQGVQSPDPRTYRLPRYQEDWSFLRDSSQKEDWLDPVKFIPLSHDGDAFLSLGGDVRETYERFHNPNFGLQPQDPNGYLLQRMGTRISIRELASTWRL